MKYISHSPEETYTLGKEFGNKLAPNTVVCFYGDLGAGKTTFIKGLAAGVLGTNGDEVNSPTFTYLNIYHGNKDLYHFDLYRLRNAEEFMSMGFDEMFDAGGICCLEWAERLSSLSLPKAFEVAITSLEETTRCIEITNE